jgi:hypothetical protein
MSPYRMSALARVSHTGAGEGAEVPLWCAARTERR